MSTLALILDRIYARLNYFVQLSSRRLVPDKKNKHQMTFVRHSETILGIDYIRYPLAYTICYNLQETNLPIHVSDAD